MEMRERAEVVNCMIRMLSSEEEKVCFGVVAEMFSNIDMVKEDKLWMKDRREG
jgi:hypothetical protein